MSLAPKGEIMWTNEEPKEDGWYVCKYLISNGLEYESEYVLLEREQGEWYEVYCSDIGWHFSQLLETYTGFKVLDITFTPKDIAKILQEQS